jgi:alpha-tubulin suppressor-like RCC1 family protein
MYKLILF